MVWTKKRRNHALRKNYSVINKLEKEGIIDERFQLVLSRLSLEDLIAVKLELTSKSSGGNIFGLPIWYSITDIVRDAILRFSMSAARTKLEAARFLGITLYDYEYFLNKYKTRGYFKNEEPKVEEPLTRY